MIMHYIRLLLPYFDTTLPILYLQVQSEKVPNPQPLKSGWSQVVRQKTRGTVSAPASPSKKQQASYAGSTRRDPSAPSWNRKQDAELIDQAAPSDQLGKQRDVKRSGIGIAANTGRAAASAIAAEPREGGSLPNYTLQLASKRETRVQENSEVTASTSTSMVRNTAFLSAIIGEYSGIDCYTLPC